MSVSTAKVHQPFCARGRDSSYRSQPQESQSQIGQFQAGRCQQRSDRQQGQMQRSSESCISSKFSSCRGKTMKGGSLAD